MYLAFDAAERRGVTVPEHGDGRLAAELVTYLLLDFLPSTARNISQGEEYRHNMGQQFGEISITKKDPATFDVCPWL
jgi:hypothetical protein